jgi:hypothetical protein
MCKMPRENINLPAIADGNKLLANYVKGKSKCTPTIWMILSPEPWYIFPLTLHLKM